MQGSDSKLEALIRGMQMIDLARDLGLENPDWWYYQGYIDRVASVSPNEAHDLMLQQAYDMGWKDAEGDLNEF